MLDAQVRVTVLHALHVGQVGLDRAGQDERRRLAARSGRSRGSGMRLQDADDDVVPLLLPRALVDRLDDAVGGVVERPNVRRLRPARVLEPNAHARPLVRVDDSLQRRALLGRRHHVQHPHAVPALSNRRGTHRPLPLGIGQHTIGVEHRGIQLPLRREQFWHQRRGLIRRRLHQRVLGPGELAEVGPRRSRLEHLHDRLCLRQR